MLGHKRNAYRIHVQKHARVVAPALDVKHSSQYGDKCGTHCILRYGAPQVTVVGAPLFMPPAKSACHKRKGNQVLAEALTLTYMTLKL